MKLDYKEIGRRIAHRRKQLGLKQATVEEMADIGEKYLYCIERATSTPVSYTHLLHDKGPLGNAVQHILGDAQLRQVEHQAHLLHPVLHGGQTFLGDGLIGFSLWAHPPDCLLYTSRCV